jgi:hypothetical protein
LYARNFGSKNIGSSEGEIEDSHKENVRGRNNIAGGIA